MKRPKLKTPVAVTLEPSEADSDEDLENSENKPAELEEDSD